MQTRKLMRPMLRDWMSQETRGVAHFFLTHSLTTANHSFTHILSLTTANEFYAISCSVNSKLVSFLLRQSKKKRSDTKHNVVTKRRICYLRP